MRSEKGDNKSEKKHWLKPLKGAWRCGRHLLIWIDEGQRRGRVIATRVVGYYAVCRTDGTVDMGEPQDISGDKLSEVLDLATKEKGTLTIWLVAGWEHFVLSGLASMVDNGAITWRYFNVDGHRLLLRGQWRGRSIIICSLGNWTGSAWDQWRSKTESRGVDLYLDSWAAIAGVCRMMQLGSIAPSAGAAGLLLWRSWLGPRIKTRGEKTGKTAKSGQADTKTWVGPVPARPLKARNAERHCAYGLVCRQLRRGFVDQPIYCIDVSSAYLLYLITTPTPILYTRHLHRPSVDELGEAMIDNTGCALVHISSPTDPYPCRRGGRVLWATGDYWTWLAGAELAEALVLSRVVAVEAAYVWAANMRAREYVMEIMSWKDRFESNGERLLAAAWRSIYSQLVGRFAAWRRTWVDCPAVHQFGRWASWLQADPSTGQIVQHRSIAGRTQRLAAKEDSGDSVPLLFGCVTAQGRSMTRRLADHARRENVVAIEADALWLTAVGWQALLRKASCMGIPPDSLKCKEVFARAWMTGEHIAVVEREGQRYLRCPGVPSDVVVGSNGNAEWPSSRPWHEDGDPAPARGVKRSRGVMSAAKIIADYSSPAMVLPWSDTVDDPMLGAELLRPLGAPGRTVEDAE